MGISGTTFLGIPSRICQHPECILDLCTKGFCNAVICINNVLLGFDNRDDNVVILGWHGRSFDSDLVRWLYRKRLSEMLMVDECDGRVIIELWGGRSIKYILCQGFDTVSLLLWNAVAKAHQGSVN